MKPLHHIQWLCNTAPFHKSFRTIPVRICAFREIPSFSFVTQKHTTVVKCDKSLGNGFPQKGYTVGKAILSAYCDCDYVLPVSRHCRSNEALQWPISENAQFMRLHL